MARAYLYTLLAVVLWSTGPVGSKAALMASRGGLRLTATQVAFWAVGLGWLGLLAAMAARRRLGRLAEVAPRGWWALVGMGLFGWVGYPVAINFAYTRLPLADAMVISYLNPVFVTLLQGPAFGRLVRPLTGWEQRPDRQARPPAARLTLGLGVCLLGVAFIATEGRLGSLVAVGSAAGAAAALFAGLAWGVYSNLGRFVAVRPTAQAGGSGDAQNLVAMAFGLAAMAAGLAAGGRLGPPVGLHTRLYLGGMGPVWVDVWVVLAVMAALNYAAGYTLWLYALEAAGAAGEAHRLPPLTYLVLVIAMAGGWLALHQSVGGGFWQGAALIAGGNAVVLWPRRREAAG